MPGRDGTGPMGQGAMTGKGMGVCAGVNAPFYGFGFGRGCGRGSGRGFGRGFGPGMGRGMRRGFAYRATPGYYNQPNSKEALQAQREQFKNMLEAIDKQIESL